MKYLKERRLKIIDGAIIIVPPPYKNMASEPECKMSAVIQVDMETIYYKRSLFRLGVLLQ